MIRPLLIVLAAAGSLAAFAATAPAPDAALVEDGPAVRDSSKFDQRRPVAAELTTHVSDGFTVAAVGDLIISRPLSWYAATLAAFKAVLDLTRPMSVVYGNIETAIFDVRTFPGSP